MSDSWVTFDCFGTLVDWNSGFTAILAPLAGARTAELLRAYHAAERTAESTKPFRPYTEILGASLRNAAAQIGLSLSETQARILPESWDRLIPFADVEEMLTELRGMNFRLGVLTNCDEDLFEQTHRQFRQRFDLVITAEQVRDYKPSSTHFEHFARVSGVDRAHWLHVACSWYHDIAPAQNLGIRRIWLDRDDTGEDATSASARVRSASDICALLPKLK